MMNLATRIAYTADRRLVRSRIKARARVVLRRYWLVFLVASVAHITHVGQEARHAEEIAQLQAQLTRGRDALRTLEALPTPVAIVISAPSRHELKRQLVTITGELYAHREDLGQ